MKLFCLVLAVSALSCLGATASAETQDKWKLFQPSGDGYRIEFPGAPTVKRDTLPSRVGPAPHVEADLTSKGFSYSVELTTYASPSDTHPSPTTTSMSREFAPCPPVAD